MMQPNLKLACIALLLLSSCLWAQEKPNGQIKFNEGTKSLADPTSVMWTDSTDHRLHCVIDNGPDHVCTEAELKKYGDAAAWLGALENTNHLRLVQNSDTHPEIDVKRFSGWDGFYPDGTAGHEDDCGCEVPKP